jgi:hypothetical protein
MRREVPSSFSTVRGGDLEWRQIVPREGLDRAGARAIVALLGDVDWGEVWHAYGPATEIPGQLTAVIAGDDPTRDEAWWNLWGNIHHQGSIYEATVPTVPVLIALASWRDYPDRGEALLILRQIAAAEGVEVWRYDDAGEIAHDRDRQRELFADLRGLLTTGARQIAARWRAEPEGVRRALVWLLSTVPEVRERYQPLVDETLPAEHQAAWERELLGGPASQEEFDAMNALEEWVQEPLSGAR